MGNQDQGPPIKAYRPRASRNCGTCRKYKRHCDRKEPSCSQCLRGRDVCPGYRSEWELVFRDQTHQTVHRSQQPGNTTAATTTTTTKRPKRNRTISPPKPHLQHGFTPPLEEIGVNYFLRHFISGGTPHSRGCLNYIPPSSTATTDPTLLASISAVGLMALAKSASQPSLAHAAQKAYSSAVQSVNDALITAPAADPTLMAVISLGVYEEISDYKSWLLHVQGAAAVLVARGKSQFKSKAGMRLFNQVRTDLITACVNEGAAIPEGVLKLQGEAHGEEMKKSYWRIGLLGVRCARLLEKFRRYGLSLADELLAEASVLERNFETFHAILLEEEPYITVPVASNNPSFTFNFIGVYKDTWSIRIWNNWRNLLMITSRIKLFLLSETLKSSSSPPSSFSTPSLPLSVESTQAMTAELCSTMQRLSNLGSDILATVPQAMQVSQGQTRNPPFDYANTVGSDHPWTVSGAYLLAGRLSVVGQSEATSSETRRWIIEKLREIDRTARVPTAIKIIEDIKSAEA